MLPVSGPLPEKVIATAFGKCPVHRFLRFAQIELFRVKGLSDPGSILSMLRMMRVFQGQHEIAVGMAPATILGRPRAFATLHGRLHLWPIKLNTRFQIELMNPGIPEIILIKQVR